MLQTPIIRPTYSEKFRCIGSECEDDCCHGWAVNIDQVTYEKYRKVSPGPLRVLMDANVLRNEQDGGCTRAYAQVQLLPNGSCPFLSEEKLCRIQLEHGARYLSSTCAEFPRRMHTIDGLKEETLSLSCPEAARMVLLDTKLLAPGKGRHLFNWDESKKARDLRFYFWPIRELAINLVRNRAYPLWQRIFLLGAFTRRLESIANGDLDRRVPALLRDFTAAVASGSLRATVETIPADLKLQLDLVVRLILLRMDTITQSPVVASSPRLQECLHEFTAGVGFEPGVSDAGCIAAYARASEEYYAPFFRNHPHILENYLVNAILRDTFPFGRTLFSAGMEPEFGKAFAVLAIQFALIKGLLIGVAGFHKDTFSEDHVVRTVQTAYRYFEHCPEFVDQALALLASREMDNARGLTMLVRN